MNTNTVAALIRRAKGDKTWRELAQEWGVDHGYLYRMAEPYNQSGDTRYFNDLVLYNLGLERVVSYRKRKSKIAVDSADNK